MPVHVSTRGGLPRRAGRVPYPPPRRSKLHIACSDFLCLCKKVRAGSFRCSSLAKPDPSSALGSGLGTRHRRRAAICLHNLFTPLAEKTSSVATLLLLSNPNPLCWASGSFFGETKGEPDAFSSYRIVFQTGDLPRPGEHGPVQKKTEGLQDAEREAKYTRKVE